MSNEIRMAAQFLSVKTLKGDFVIPHLDIIRVEAYGPYSQIYYGKNHICCCRHLKAIVEEIRASPFLYKVHRSYIINVNKIKGCVKRGRGYILTMSDYARIPVSKGERKAFMEYLNKNEIAMQVIKTGHENVSILPASFGPESLNW